MGHAVSKTAIENEIFEHPGEGTAKEFSSNETVKLESSFAAAVFDDAANSKTSNSQQPPTEPKIWEEDASQPKAVPPFKPRSKALNGISKHNFGFSKFSKNGDDKVSPNFMGKFKNKFANIDNVLHAKAETSNVVKPSSVADTSARNMLERVLKKPKQKLQLVSESNEPEIDKQKSLGLGKVSENPSVQLEIFVDAKGGLKVDLSGRNKTATLSKILPKEEDFTKLQLKQLGNADDDIIRKKIVLENEEKQSNLKKNENAEEIKFGKDNRKHFCKSNSKNIENLGIKKSQEVILLQNHKPRFENANRIANNAFRKQFYGNKCDEDIILLDNLMLTSKGNECGKTSNCSNVKFEGIQIATPKVTTIRESDMDPSVEIVNTEFTNETVIENEFPVHKVLIRACSKGNHVKFDNPYSMFDMIIPKQLKANPNIYKNSSISLSSHTSQATENDISDIDEVVSTATTSSIPKSFNLSEQVESSDFCSSSEFSNDSNVTKRSLQRLQGLTSFTVNDPKQLEYFHALQRISNPSAKLIFLLELKHKRKFKTLEELYQKPVEMINFLYRGELLEPTELQPVKSFISYEEILNSIVSGI